jgi:hypothetical protein
MLQKQKSHGRIAEAAVEALCWMNGIRAYNTAGLRANFEGSDLLVETEDPRRKLWVQVKAGYPVVKDQVYLTQCTNEKFLTESKFAADFVVFVNLDPLLAVSHQHDGTLGFPHLAFYVVPRDAANEIFRRGVNREAVRPKRDGSRRSLANVAVHASKEKMGAYRDAWGLLRAAAEPPSTAS